MSEYRQVRQQVFELMTEAGRLIESLPTEGQRRAMHQTATDDLVDARNSADVFHGGALFHAFLDANRRYWNNNGHSVRVPKLRVVKDDVA